MSTSHPPWWPAPAKLNLFLHVTGRRADGYHTLQTLFQFLDRADRLRFEITQDGHVTRVTPLPGVAEDADLSVRAARLLQQASGCPLGARIFLDKRLPMGGGLGGGSSDAATTLLALNHLWGTHQSLAQLATLGLGLGADVPVFLHGHAAWAEGVGEQLTPVDLPEPWYVVLAPPVQVSTAMVFQSPELTRSTPAITIRDFHAGRGRNDLEPVVCGMFPEVANTLKWLNKFGHARMSGSGACVFLAVESAARGREILALCPETLARGFVAQGVNTHPIHLQYGDVMNWGVAKR